MSEKTLELKVGIFIFIGIILLFIIVFSIGKIYVFQPGYRISVLFNFAGGLSAAAPVRLAGVEIGEVDNIKIFYDEEISTTRIEVLTWIKKDVRIEKNSIVRVNALGLLGEKYLEIMPGSKESGFLEEGGVLTGEDPIMMDVLAGELKALADSTAVIMGRLERGEGTIGKLLVEEKIYNDLELLVEDIRKHPWKLFHKTKDKNHKTKEKKKR